ncbi:MAG: hypothetical protein ACREOZ_03910, partial [Gloeomargaritales cyanobacterium]
MTIPDYPPSESVEEAGALLGAAITKCGVVITKASSTSSSLYSSVGGAIFGRMGSGSMHGGSSLHSKSESGYNSNSTSTSAAASVGGTGGGGSNLGQANATAANSVSVLKPAVTPAPEVAHAGVIPPSSSFASAHHGRNQSRNAAAASTSALMELYV